MYETNLTSEVAVKRQAAHPILPLFLNRWSPRSFTDEAVAEEDLMVCLEAARWAPSSNNEQPWRFLYARTPDDRERFASCLVEFNRQWAGKAPVLAALCARKTFSRDGSANHHHAFDSGAAWVLFALEATRRGLHAHGMAGFDLEKAREVLKVPGDHEVIAFVALGHRGPKEALHERLREREGPNGRNPVESFAFEGAFPPDRG